MTAPPAFSLVSRWRVPGTAEAAFDALTDGSIMRWWSAVYLAAAQVAPGDADGRGRTVDLLTRGRLPYRLRWRATVTDLERPRRIAVAATGDLVGHGEWTIAADGGFVSLVYVWNVEAARGWMRAAMPVMKPVFAWNHGWAMRQGEAGLARHLGAGPQEGPRAEPPA